MTAKLKQSKLRKIRKKLLLNQEGKCYFCGWDLISKTDNYATIEHLIPKILGGTNEQWNLVVSCRKCNNEKSNQIWYKDDGKIIKITPKSLKYFLSKRLKKVLLFLIFLVPLK